MAEWAGNTYGNNWMHRWLIRLVRNLDLRILYGFSSVFVVPVVLVVNPSAGITYRYFRERHGYGKAKAAWKTYVNHCLFSQVVIDKFAMYAGKRFEVNVEGDGYYKALAAREEGFVQLSAHIGNYEIAGYTLVADNKPFDALVYFGEKESVMENRRKIFSRTNINMIPIRPDMGHLFEINAALAGGHSVSMPADRIFGSEKSVTRDFLGREAEFPSGPFRTAAMRGLDVLAVNVIKTSTKRYMVFVTPLDYDKSASRTVQVNQLCDAYVEELGKRVKEYPTQWYNYFEFWKK